MLISDFFLQCMSMKLIFRHVRKIVKMIIRFIVSVCLSIHVEQLGYHGMNLCELLYLFFLGGGDITKFNFH